MDNTPLHLILTNSDGTWSYVPGTATVLVLQSDEKGTAMKASGKYLVVFVQTDEPEWEFSSLHAATRSTPPKSIANLKMSPTSQARLSRSFKTMTRASSSKLTVMDKALGMEGREATSVLADMLGRQSAYLDKPAYPEHRESSFHYILSKEWTRDLLILYSMPR